MRHVISAYVQNKPGVLAHVAGMFSARGYNIDSLVVGRTDDERFSRMTIVVVGDDRILEQVRKQLAKIVEVVRVRDFKDIEYVERDLMLVRVSAEPATRSEIVQLANLFRGRVIDVARQSLTIEMAGPEAKLEAFLDLLRPYGIRELARTGVIALQRGQQSDHKPAEEDEAA